LNTENGNLTHHTTYWYTILNNVYGVWYFTHVYCNDNYDIWLGTINDDNIWIMDGIIIIYVLIRLYLCGLTSTIWWGLIVAYTVVQLTGLMRIMMYELVTVFIIWWLLIDSNTFERGSANSYMGWFSLTLRFILVATFDMNMIMVLTLLIRLSKLPVYGLHQWLPKVHVEASIFRSIILAGIILKMGIVFIGLFGYSMPMIIIGLTSRVFLMFGSDGKVVMAYSSVIHISLCGLVIGWIGIIVGASHVVISPLIFMAVYCRYMNSGSRILSPSFSSWTWGVILIVNLRFPLIGGFMSELYLIVILGRMILIAFILQYVLMGLVHIALFFKIKRLMKVEVKRWIVLFIMLY